MTVIAPGSKRHFDLTAMAAIAIGLLLIAGSFVFIGEIRNGIRSTGWPAATGRMESHDTRRGCSRDGGYAPVPLYRYDVAGRSYEGTLITATQLLCFADEREALAFLGREYPLEATVKVFYDPAAPDSAVLRPGEYSKLGFALAPGMWLIALALIYAGWKAARPQAKLKISSRERTAPAAVKITLHRKGPNTPDAE